MMSKKSPQLRFEGFTDDWEERKVKDIFKITRGQVLAATETSEEKSDISPFPVYSSQTKNNGLMGYYKDYLFDTAITWTTDGANAGTVSYRSGRFYSTNVNGVLISDKGYTNKAISEILNLEAWKWVSHVGNPKLMNNVMGDISIMIPSSFEEQDRLSNFLNQLDDTITLHQRKLDLLKEQKKGYLQKMFPKNGAKVPELRFAGFADDWEVRKLNEVSDIYDGTHQTPKYQDNGVMFLSVENIKTLTSNKFISREAFEDEFKIRPQRGDVLMTRIGDIGTANVVETDEDLSYYVSLALFKSEELNPYFLQASIYAPFVQDQIWKRTLHIAFPKKINKNEIGQVPINVPTLAEQTKIGSFFKQLDKTIALHQRKLDLLKEQKKGFLQTMFVK